MGWAGLVALVLVLGLIRASGSRLPKPWVGSTMIPAFLLAQVFTRVVHAPPWSLQASILALLFVIVFFGKVSVSCWSLTFSSSHSWS